MLYLILLLQQAVLLLDYSLELSFGELHELEGLFVLFTDIVAVFEALKIELEMEHLLVLWVVVEADDGNAVVKLEGERVHGVVYENDVSEASLVEDAHVLYVEVWVASPDTAWPVVSGLDKLSLRVEVVDDWVGVLLL